MSYSNRAFNSRDYSVRVQILKKSVKTKDEDVLEDHWCANKSCKQKDEAEDKRFYYENETKKLDTEDQ